MITVERHAVARRWRRARWPPPRSPCPHGAASAQVGASHRATVITVAPPYRGARWTSWWTGRCRFAAATMIVAGC